MLQPTGFIKVDGTSVTTAEVPFAEGIKLPDDKTVTFGTGDDFVLHYDSSGDHLELAAPSSVVWEIDAYSFGFPGTGLRVSVPAGGVKYFQLPPIMYLRDESGDAIDGQIHLWSGAGDLHRLVADDDALDITASGPINFVLGGDATYTSTDSGNFVINSGGGTFQFQRNITTGKVTSLFKHGSALADTETMVDLFFDSSDNVSTTDASAVIRAIADGDHTSSAKGGKLSFQVKSSSDNPAANSTQIMLIDSLGARLDDDLSLAFGTGSDLTMHFDSGDSRHETLMTTTGEFFGGAIRRELTITQTANTQDIWAHYDSLTLDGSTYSTDAMYGWYRTLDLDVGSTQMPGNQDLTGALDSFRFTFTTVSGSTDTDVVGLQHNIIVEGTTDDNVDVFGQVLALTLDDFTASAGTKASVTGFSLILVESGVAAVNDINLINVSSSGSVAVDVDMKCIHLDNLSHTIAGDQYGVHVDWDVMSSALSGSGYGFYAHLDASTFAGTSYGFYADVTDATTANYSFYAAAGDALLVDSVDLIFGTGSDATLGFDGTNLLINPKAVGSGTLRFDTDSKIEFRDANAYIYSNAASEVTVAAATLTTVGVAGDIELGDSTLRKMIPQTDEKMDLGDSTHYFNDIYVNNIYTGGFCSVTTTANSTASATTRNIFDEDTYSSYTSDANVTAEGITYTTTDGKFTIDTGFAGVYVITVTLNMMISSTDEVDIELREDGVAFYNHDTLVHSSVDPIFYTISLIRSLADAAYIEVWSGSTDGVDSCTYYGGTTFTMHKIGAT